VTVVTHPQPGTVVRADFTEGFRAPEMVKRRPCIVLSPPLIGRARLCTVVPLSTTPPNRMMPWHLELRFDPPLPEPYESPVAWLKGDMVLTVAFHRLRLLFAGTKGGQRVYDVRVLAPEVFEAVRECVRSGLDL
jgi:mRNA interferase MazF